MKRSWITLIVIAMVLMKSLSVSAYTEGYFNYNVKDDSVIITEYFGESKEVTVPSMIAGNPVNTIAKGAFVDTDIEKLLLPDTIMTIEEGAISGDIEVVYSSNVSEKIDSDKEESGSDAVNLDSERTNASKQSNTVEESKGNDVVSDDEGSEQGEIVLEDLEEFFDKKKNETEQEAGKWIIWTIGVGMLVILAVVCIFFIKKERRGR